MMQRDNVTLLNNDLIRVRLTSDSIRQAACDEFTRRCSGHEDEYIKEFGSQVSQWVAKHRHVTRDIL